MSRVKKNIILFIMFGCIYIVLEVFMRMFRGEMVGIHGLTYPSFAGWTSIWMFPIGGSCIFIIGYLNEKKKLPIWSQVILGTLTVFSIEFVTGLFFNVWLGLHLWDYSTWPLNIMGQITLIYLPVWALLCPLGIWLDDVFRDMLENKTYRISILDVYKSLFTGKS